MDIELSGSQVLLTYLVIAIAIIVLIVVMRRMFGSKENLREKYKDSAAANFMSRVKYPDVDAFRHSGTFFGLGLATALAFIVAGFAWTDYEKQIDVSQYSLEVDEEIEIEPPRTAEPPPPPPPPPPPVIEEVPEEEIEEDDQPEFEDQTVEEETVFDEPPPPPKEEAAPPPPPPPPPPPAPEVDEIFKVVEQKPLFGGCTDQACSDKKLIEYLYKNLKYPAIARENGVEGRVYIQFVVEKNGKITDGKIVRDIGAGCGEAALKVVNNMNNLAQSWTPGKQRGKAVRVLFTLPVTFKLES